MSSAVLKESLPSSEDLADAQRITGLAHAGALPWIGEETPHGVVELGLETRRAKRFAAEGRAGGRGADDRRVDARVAERPQDFVFDLAE